MIFSKVSLHSLPHRKERASVEMKNMFQSDFLRFCSTFPQFEVWLWICLSMFSVFLLLSLCSPFHFLKATRLNDSSTNGDDDESSEGVVVDSKASSSSTDEYDVFLSFRGPDTRQGFTDVLYDTMTRAGIRVFRDDDEVSTGQPLQKILRAIETSQICIPIFSRTFAESSWCLREVAKMVELKKHVMPIFYDVKPDDVKLKTGAYRNHLKMHRKKKNGKEQVKVWEDALRQVARIKGKEVLNTRYTEFCKKLVDDGLRKLKPRRRSYDEFFVGTGSQIKSLMKLVDVESPDVRYIGIHGMGGIGKTTLAKALYAELSNDFDCSCFLADVRELSSRCNGLQDLGKQLQEGLDPEFTRGFNSLRDIEERFRRKKVLIVLDDVNKPGQIEKLAGHSSWFGSGSRIIVTTRDLNVLKKYGKLDQNNEVHFIKMKTLKHDQALELFQWHAFREEKPPLILKTISEKIVSTCGGLPLALQVMGSRLSNVKDEGVWRDVLERSREVQDKDVKERLMISFDALENDQKKIFLDIACIDDMKYKVRSVCMWEASKLYPHLCLAVLSSMSLIRCDDNEIWMHDLLKELGKGIVREETCLKRSRVWKSEEAVNFLLNKKGQENVEVLCVDKPLQLSPPPPLSPSHQPDAVEAETRKRSHVTTDPSNFRSVVQQLTGVHPGTVDILNPGMLDPQSSSPLIGVERKVEEVENLLQVGVSDIRTVGIYGTGGIGKTSLAKLVFNRISNHFEGCSFLSDTRETTRQFGGLEILQTKLISEILRRECTEIGSSDEGICYIREVLCDMRVLVVLDNVDSGFCLDRFVGDVDSFGPGSRIIVIARSKTDLPKCTETYEVLKMNDQEAFTLFTTHAFKGSTSSCRVSCDVNHVLSQKILCAIGRIPLAVEVIGSHLSGEPVDEWGSTLEKLEDFPDEELQRRLKLSYDALSDQQKKIFLDVACFINGEDSQISSYVWRESEGLKGLVSLSLVKIGDNNELRMHDELRKLGRELSGTEKMNRFLIQVRDFAALLAEKDLGRVEALNLCGDKRSQYQDSDFQKMRSLRFLKVANANMCGDFSDVFTNLRWLHWEGCPRTLMATNFYLKNLVILNLSRSKVTSIWEGWSQIKATNSLKVLNLTGCMNLITSPNLSYFPNLERLILEHCSSLVRLDPSIQCLEKLQFLNLKFCTELNVLPKELGSLKALTEILIDGTSIRDIPISIGHLVSLETLSASSCVSLTHLPSSISYLTSLSELTLDGAQIHELPELIGDLKILWKLSLKDCRWMQKLPDSIGKLKDSLSQLDVSGTGISEFPNSIQDLQTLKVLRMNSCFIRVFPKVICYLSNLEELHASHCRSLESDVPPEIERLRSLQILRLGFSRISSLPLSILNLPHLQNLDLDHCNMLSMLPHLPSSLSRLCFNSRRMVKFPNLPHNLEELILADGDYSEELLIPKTDFECKFLWIPGLPKLKAMELHHSGIHSIDGGKYCSLLRKLTLSCTNLEFISLDPLPLLTLSVHHCRSLKILEAGSFQCLVELQVLDSAVRRVRDLGSLKGLRVLNVSKCQVEDLDGLEELCSLVRLSISHCEYLQKLPNLSRLVSLRSLAVSYCDSLESLPNLSELKMLKELEIRCCKKLSEVHGLEDLRSLEKVQITECEAAKLPKG